MQSHSVVQILHKGYQQVRTDGRHCQRLKDRILQYKTNNNQESNGYNTPQTGTTFLLLSIIMSQGHLSSQELQALPVNAGNLQWA